MCTKQEKKEVVSFLASRIDIPEDEIVKAITLAKKRIKEDGHCSDPLNPDQIFEESCANAALYGISQAGQRLATITESSLNMVGAFMPTLSAEL